MIGRCSFIRISGFEGSSFGRVLPMTTISVMEKSAPDVPEGDERDSMEEEKAMEEEKRENKKIFRDALIP